MNIDKLLEDIGLTPTQAKVYQANLKVGERSATTIAKQAKLYRQNTYDALEELKKLGLVSVIVKNNTKMWTPEHPKKLREILKEKLQKIDLALPNLKELYKSKVKEQNVRLLLGYEGMKNFFYDILKEKKTLHLIGATGNIYAQLKYFAPNWIREINEAGIKKKYLLNFDVKSKKRHFKDFKDAQIRTLPKNFKTATQIFLYGQKSCIVVWEDEPIAVLIESKQVTKGFRGYFNFMWDLSK